MIWPHLLYKTGQNKILKFPFALINYSLNSSISFSYCLNQNFTITKDCTSTAWCLRIKLLWNGKIFHSLHLLFLTGKYLPFRVHISANLCPHSPFSHTRTVSPGSNRLVQAASIAPWPTTQYMYHKSLFTNQKFYKIYLSSFVGVHVLRLSTFLVKLSIIYFNSKLISGFHLINCSICY